MTTRYTIKKEPSDAQEMFCIDGPGVNLLAAVGPAEASEIVDALEAAYTAGESASLKYFTPEERRAAQERYIAPPAPSAEPIDPDKPKEPLWPK